MHAAWRGVAPSMHAAWARGMLRDLTPPLSRIVIYHKNPSPYEINLFAREPFPLLTFFAMLWLFQKRLRF